MLVVSRLPRPDAGLTPFWGLFLLRIRCFRRFSIVFCAFFRFLDEIEMVHCKLDVVILAAFINISYANILSLYVDNKSLSGPMAINSVIIEKFGT